jgi:hypothetical protein
MGWIMMRSIFDKTLFRPYGADGDGGGGYRQGSALPNDM